MTTSFEAVFEHLTLPCCIINNKGQVTGWNKALAKLSRVSKRRAVGKSLHTLGEFAALLADQWKYVAANEPLIIRPITLGEFSFIPVFSPIPKVGWAIVLEAKQAVAIKGKRADLVSTVTHDLKTPLSAMRGYVSLIENLGTLNEKQKQFTDRLNQSIEEMLDMIDNLLSMAWIDAGMKMEMADIDLGQIAKHIASKYVEFAHSHQIELQQKIASVPLVRGDERRLKQVVDNLISNAIKYSPDGGEVVVSVTNTNGQVTFAVTDTGIGIAPDDVQKVFNRFYRVSNDKTRRIKGTGLGLAISYDIIREHGATIHVESVLGEGSSFSFTLPIQA